MRRILLISLAMAGREALDKGLDKLNLSQLMTYNSMILYETIMSSDIILVFDNHEVREMKQRFKHSRGKFPLSELSTYVEKFNRDGYYELEPSKKGNG